jgi:hypothetical protein
MNQTFWSKGILVLGLILALAWTATQAWAGEKATPSTVPTWVAPGQVSTPTFNYPRQRVFNPPWTPSVRADPDSTTYSCLDGGLSVTGPGKLITAYNYCTDGGQSWPWRICNSTDYGATWTARTIMSGTGLYQFDDISAANKRDSCIELVMKNVSGYTLYFVRSTNSGVTWRDTLFIPQAASGSGVDYPKIDQRGPNIMVGYYNTSGNGYIGVCRSTNWGTTWNTSQAYVSNATGQGNCPRFSVAPSTNAYFMWGQPAAWQPSTVWFNRSVDLGATWGTPTQILALNMSSHFPSTRISHTFPVMEVAPNNNIYCVVQDMLQGNGWDVAFIKSTDQGTTWSTPVRVNDDVSTPNADQLEPWIEVDAYGNIHVFWIDNRNYYSTNTYACDVYYSYSTDQGVTWAANERVNDISPISSMSSDFSRMGDYQVIDSDPTHVYCQWTQCNAQGTAGSDFTSSRLLPAAYAQFMLAAVVADTMNPTAAKTDSVTVSSFLNFNSPVTMTLDSIRPATGTITVAFNPNPVTPPPNGSVKTGMRITTTATPANNYVLYYHGTGDTITRWASMNLWVTAPTFALQSTPRVQTVFCGDSASYADTLVSISGFSSPCTLSASVSPPAPSITVSFIPNNIVIPTGGRRMKVQTTTATPAVGYAITITARSGSEVKTLVDSLYVRYSVQGPDPYGYYAYDNTDVGFTNSPTYNWIELNPSRGGNGTTVGISGDDMSLRKLFGIRARHYGFHGDSASICTNGWLAVGRTTLQVYSNAALPSTSFVPGGVALLWDDLTISGTGTCWYRSDANQRFICEWDSVPTLGGSYCGTFEIIVMDTSLTPGTANTRDSEIILQWKSVGSIGSTTVGQQNQAMSVGLNSLYNGTYDPQMATITGGRATKYTTDPPHPISGVELNPLVVPAVPVRFALGPAVPNPSGGPVGIAYALPQEAVVSLKVYNLSGQLVKTLVAGKEQPGYKHVSWDGRSENGSKAASGVYFYRMEAGSFTATQKMVVIR